MSKNKITIPTLEEATERGMHNKATPLDRLIFKIQPEIERRSIRLFRECLENALQYAIDSQGSFRLTPDAPVHRGAGDAVMKQAAANCFYELWRHAFKYDEPDKETGLQIIERYLSVFDAKSRPPCGG